jgi:hypothetical protein
MTVADRTSSFAITIDEVTGAEIFTFAPSIGSEPSRIAATTCDASMTDRAGAA